ncbi:AraC family transcriptional regulator [Rhodococcus spelaei]|uniref:AraC family transcriptional regulator n=1 Tax=Rhodococcus spelaei TaxID=2546320 RepID=A0A541BLX6_9NOCA|nr:AraC family transcriptional regulator [Rhodococcus spelaei]TQF73332.1 AraC family transcriptional regulator [Rhodococcus spelaei]
MDPLAGLLDGPRSRGAFLLRSILSPPWSLRIQDHAPLTLVAMVRGRAWVAHDGADPVPMHQGDVAVVRGPDPYTVSDRPGTTPQVIVHPGQICTTPDGESLSEAMDLGIRTWGNNAHGEVVMITGTYQVGAAVGDRLLRALPRLLTVRRDEWDSPLLPLLGDEMAKDEPGQDVMLDRLLDLVLITVLRTWFARPESSAPAWYRAHGDDVIGPALRRLQNNPAHPWTVASLASEVGVSRASLARRFTELVGEPPMSYLTGWRLTLAADLLRTPEATIGAVARKVGYGSSFALSAAFKRVHGMSPREYRQSLDAA